MCTSQGDTRLGKTLGYDAVLYKRPTPRGDDGCYIYEEFTIFITETVGDDEWDDILSHQIIGSDTEGWQVFHLNERANGRLNRTLTTLTIHVLAKGKGNSTHLLLNRMQLQDMFVLNDGRPDELDKQPVIVQYILKPVESSGVSPFVPSPDPFPFFKRSLLQPLSIEKENPNKQCPVEDKIVKLTDGFPHNNNILISPHTINIGRCGVLCRPTKFADLELLSYSTSLNDMTIDIMPNATIKKCVRTIADEI